MIARPMPVVDPIALGHEFTPSTVEEGYRVVINRLTVDGKDYFLPDPVTELKAQILAAIQAGGGYVTIPPLRGGPGLEILFSPGMPVSWAQIDVGGDPQDASAPQASEADFDY